MKKTKIMLISSIFLLGLVVGVVIINKPDDKEVVSKCSIMSLQKAELLSSEIQKDVIEYKQEKSEIFGLSSEGGEQIKYIDDSRAVKLVEQIFLGETGKSETKYYYLDDRVFYVLKSNSEYEKPISVDSSGNISKVDVKKFTLDENQKVCEWYLNERLQNNSLDTQELVVFLINSIK